MNNNAVEVNYKFCAVDTDKRVRILEKNDYCTEFNDILNLENDLEIKQNILNKLNSKIKDHKGNIDFYLVYGLIMMFITVIVFKNYNGIHVLAPLTMSLFGFISSIKDFIDLDKIECRASKISNEIANIEYDLGKMKRKSKLREIKLNKELRADNSELKTYVELRNILLNHLQNTSENIRSERELVLIKK